jgi:FAD/FMN-containing dehydrogenase
VAISANPPGELERDLRALGDIPITTDLGERAASSADVYSRGATCLAVVRPRTAEELARAVRHLAAAGYDLLPRGGGLTYSAGYLADDERGIVIDTAGLNRIIDLNPADMYVTVEAGVTWQQIHEALRPHGLRLPCFGTFSGAAARVGGGLSSGALFLGTARYGTVADSLLGLEVALADGTLLRTGQAALRNVRKPAYRTYGPDLTGPFVHDCGCLGIKTKATFRLIRTPAETGYASYAFPSVEAAAAALSDVARAELAEDAYVFDPPTTRNTFAGVDMRRAVRALAGAATNESSALRGLAAAGRLAWSGARGTEVDGYSLHVVAAARSAAALRDDLAASDAIAARHGGRALPDSVPRGARANLFPPLNDILGPTGDRWVAINAKVAHSDAMAVHAAVDRILEQHAARLTAAGVRTKRMFIALSNHSFSYEPAFMWSDEWLPLHRSAPEPRHLAKLHEPAPNPAARAAVTAVRAELVNAFAALGAASNQIGRLYPYADSLDPATRRLLEQLKRDVDPTGRMNPGVLGLPTRPLA